MAQYYQMAKFETWRANAVWCEDDTLYFDVIILQANFKKWHKKSVDSFYASVEQYESISLGQACQVNHHVLYSVAVRQEVNSTAACQSLH